MNDPGHEQHSQTLEWVGRDFDPEHFDLDERNEALQQGPPKSEDEDETWLT